MQISISVTSKWIEPAWESAFRRFLCKGAEDLTWRTAASQHPPINLIVTFPCVSASRGSPGLSG